MKFQIGLLLILPVFLIANETIFPLGELGSVRYIHDTVRMFQIDRLLPSGEILYSHTYNYDEQNRLVSETLIGDLGDIVYESPTIAKSPYHTEICEYDTQHNLIRHTQDDTIRNHSYNNLNELISEDTDDHCTYDRTGNLIQKGTIHFSYDENYKLQKVSSPNCETTFTYDSEDRRVSKTSNGKTENYIYPLGINEIAITDENGHLKELRIPGLSAHKDFIRPIAIETKDAIYAPIHNFQGNIVKLIDIISKKVISLSLSDPFGRGLSNNSPVSWIFAGKHYDPETGLVYFGHRFYLPDLKKWLTPDPAFQTPDPYQYCFNNPLAFCDPDGQFTLTFANLAWGAGTILTFPVLGTGVIAVATGAAIAYVTYEGVKAYNQSSSKTTDIYAPDRPLPSDKHGIPIPDTDVPHTQLGTRNGSKGKYPKAREFDEYGNPVRDIEFTDHGRDDHPNPHQHRREENPSGGTKIREAPEPVPEWSYDET